MTLDDIRQRCVLRDGHWLFRGALSAGKWPRIWGPDLSRAANCMPRSAAGWSGNC